MMLDHKTVIETDAAGSWLADTVDRACDGGELLALGFFDGFAALKSGLLGLADLGLRRDQMFLVGPNDVWSGAFGLHWSRPTRDVALPKLLHWIVADTPPTNCNSVRTEADLRGRRIADTVEAPAKRVVSLLHQSLASKHLTALHTHLQRRDGVLLIDKLHPHHEADVRQTLILHARRGVQLHDVPPFPHA